CAPLSHIYGHAHAYPLGDPNTSSPSPPLIILAAPPHPAARICAHNNNHASARPSFWPQTAPASPTPPVAAVHLAPPHYQWGAPATSANGPWTGPSWRCTPHNACPNVPPAPRPRQ